jgi:uncharacterized Rossmann fold enzyme
VTTSESHVEFDEWEPVYERLLAALGYDRAGDERARDRLAELTDPFDLRRLRERLGGATVAIAGGAPTLADPGQLALAREADAVLAASVAADVCRRNGIAVDCMVTDLDKNPDTARGLTHEGVPVAVHAHGDNVALVESVVPDCDSRQVLPTTQAAPAGSVRNFGGFTDGDRAAFLADHLGAAELRFPGWDLDDPSVDAEKATKLDWAARLLRWLERRRDARFAPLNGRRDALDADPLTPPYDN